MTLGESFNWWADVSTAAGLILTLVGAWVAARSVMLSEDDALKIGLARFGSEIREENLRLPHVQNLLASSKSARLGLFAVAIGSGMQLWPVLVRVIANLI
ncbi:hypothetical protein N7376_15680 [Brucella intermedia GD04153]|uniref:Uncharacterized protein n=1 Tax=Brucella intermedia GD04153 TaxID=2975438 RepID=A0AA42GYP7_9HYPH|nr:hypothetical protein [Brucella intermedia]MDH0125448.1 hypothetical protein [Brucella intermedia GD04153]